jgi:hypothetical protein
VIAFIESHYIFYRLTVFYLDKGLTLKFVLVKINKKKNVLSIKKNSDCVHLLLCFKVLR